MNQGVLSAALITALAVAGSALGAGEPAGPVVIVAPASIGQGEIAVVTVQGAQGPVSGTLDEKDVHFFPSKESWKAIVGIDLFTAPGEYELAMLVNGRSISRVLKVVKKEYEVQRLTLPRDMVELSPENAARTEREAVLLRAIWPGESGRHWDGDFINPLEGRIGGRFGLRRIINSVPKNPHSGIDVSADEGAEIRAPNSAVVVLVDDLFYSGISVILDHGNGLYTMFFHLSRSLVKPGQTVSKGEVFALVGSTGRSTGPHLHWGVRMQGARVDPLELLKLKLE